ncbi:hypothetical protein SAMN04487886_104327 [Clostridium sp. DSM 8431]|uniref:hypothetical protein n=1 Tax=Clostridium sp. DSM 8431 TaxID=1761781 RepID=UPI0008ED52D4|nr:hypothetical protein [Clostridium sp. DSM 8431]SFU50845.1 hypothetical protein SAMN04487886_104327 [Clostridium sp. DSM 8431]
MFVRIVNSFLSNVTTRLYKGVNKRENINVNSKVPKEKRRVPFENMIYIADGPSDVPAFAVVRKNGGRTFAIYPKNNIKAFKQVEQLRMDNRIDMYSEADYREGTTTYMWITNKIKDIAERICLEEKHAINSIISKAPRHIIE